MKRLLTSALAVTLLAGSLTAAYADERRDHRRGEGRAEGDRSQEWKGDRRDRGDAQRSRGDHRADYRDNHRNDNRYDRRDDRRDARRYERRYDDRHGYDRSPQHHRYRVVEYRRPYGYYHRAWHRGDRLPRGWYGPAYVVDHYHHYNLRRPPHGYHWVRVNNDIILAAIATGVVLEVIDDLFY